MDKRFEELIKIILEESISDLHFEFNDVLRIQGRVNKEFINIPTKKNDERLLNYLLFKADLDLSNICNPQSGSFDYTYNQRILSFRFAYLKSNNTISAVLRVLNYHTPLSLEQVFLIGKQRKIIKEIINNDNGLILISGPTGSGKTTTAYSVINYLNIKKIYTIEDPIEIGIKGVNQIQTNNVIGLTYNNILKQVLRHDPDIIFIGEIRDEETARIAIRCALTGHLVISTIHSNDCRNTISRLLDLGVNSFDIEDTLIGVINQRLFTLKDNVKRFALYEILERTEIRNLIKGKEINYETISSQIEYAKEKGWL